jgi:hypothetical protein
MRIRAMLGAAVLLAGCTVAGPDSDASSTVESDALPDSVIEDLYLDTIRSEDPSLYAVASDDLVDIGEAFCQMIDEAGGDTDRALLQAVVAISESGMETSTAGFIIGAAVPAFCPEYRAAMQRSYDSGG